MRTLILTALCLSACRPTYPACASDDDCATRGEVCANQQCQQCRDDVQCAAGPCVDGLCTVVSPLEVVPPDPTPPEAINAAAPVAACDLASVLFAFDSSALRPREVASLSAVAACLARAGTPVRLEGHADERGTAAYNLALGERRAAAVLDYLDRLGVHATAVSLGESQPVCREHSEDCWARNRRVELR